MCSFWPIARSFARRSSNSTKSCARYGRLAAERQQLDRELARLEEERNAVEHQSRVVELAITLRERWGRRKELENELATLSGQTPMPAGAVERLDALNSRLQSHQQRLERLQSERAALRAEGAGLAVQDSLRRQAARIEALQEQGPWMTNLQSQVDRLEKEIAATTAALAAEHRQLGLEGQGGPAVFPSLSPRVLAMLQSAGRAMRQGRQRFAELQKVARGADELVQSLSRDIEVALSGREDRELPAAIDRAGNLVAQLRRRIQIDERLEQMARCQRELDEQSHELLKRQMLPVWLLAGLGAAFVLGVVLVLAGLFMPTSLTGSLGWALALLGLAGSGAAAVGKVMFERSNARQLEACQKQINLFQLQVKQTSDDRDALDGQLPRGGGPIAARAGGGRKGSGGAGRFDAFGRPPHRRAARGCRGETAGGGGRAGFGRRARRWRQSLVQAGLPRKLAPRQLKRLAASRDQIALLQRQLTERQEELGHRRRELDSLVGRIAQLVADAGVEVAAGSPAEQLRQLAEALARQEAAATRREAIQECFARFAAIAPGRRKPSVG